MEQQSTSNKPRHNVQWIEAIVKWTRYDCVAIYDYPATHNSKTIFEVHKGDMVYISKRYRREDWCLVQIGHMLGWVFLQDVRFYVQSGKSPRPKTRPPQAKPEPAQQQSQDQFDLPSEWDTTPVTTQPIIKPGTGELNPDTVAQYERQHQQQEPAADNNKKSLIKRMINFFQR